MWKLHNLPSSAYIKGLTAMEQPRRKSLASELITLVGVDVLLKASIGLFSMYWDHKMISTVLEKMHSNPDERTEVRPAQLKRIIQERMDSNNIDVEMSGLPFRPAQNGVQMDWQYEMRRTWLGNVDLVVTFTQNQEFSQ